jgi:class 3 adenylate cyclase/CHASE2 domain-containing sensor protein
VNFRPLKRLPLLLAAAVIISTVFLRILNPDLLQRIEQATYDLRVRAAVRFSPPAATNFGFAFIDQESIEAVRGGRFGYKYGLYWPRQVYGRVVQELAEQGAKVVAFDVVFGELRPDHPLVQMADGSLVESDEYLALQMRHTSNVVLAVTPGLALPELFRTNALAVGDISTEKDSDGILRRVKAFRTYRRWHPAFLRVESDPEFGIDLRQARMEPGKIVLPRADHSEITVPLDSDGNFDLADFYGDKLPPGMPRKAQPFTTERVWHMGIVIAARELNLDLKLAAVDLKAGRITLRGPGGIERVLPVDPNGFFLIDWSLPPDDPRLFRRPIGQLLAENRDRLHGMPIEETNAWRGKVAIIGSAVAGGNDLTDRGATPLLADTLLVSKHWNVANSIIMGRFIRPFTLGEEICLIVLLGILSALLTWNLRALPSAAAIVGLVALFVGTCFAAYIQWRVWIPLVLPTGAALLVTWAVLTAWRVFFEQTERRRVRSVFSKIVSPNVVNELLGAEKLSLGGARREVSVFFADVRGFTEFTDVSHEQAVEHVQAAGLTGALAEALLDQRASEALETVNLYLGRVADLVKQHDGTLDKYIGDCVMAFWGAPTPNPRHALSSVRAAIDAQRAIDSLNALRAGENHRIDAENQRCVASGGAVKPLLPLLALGTGINTGIATVGLMGSDAHILNYTVFGREVNVASRLEGVSGRGRIIISASTHEHLRRDDPELAGTCIELPPVEVKGIREPVRIFEVPWRNTLASN